MMIKDIGCGYQALSKETVEQLLAMWDLNPRLFSGGYCIESSILITMDDYHRTLKKTAEKFFSGKANKKELKFLEALGFIHKAVKNTVEKFIDRGYYE